MSEQHDRTMKRCSACGLLYPFAEYYRDRTSRDGHRPDCKGCYRVMSNRKKLEEQKRNAEAIAEDRDKKRREMDAKLASMGLLQN